MCVCVCKCVCACVRVCGTKLCVKSQSNRGTTDSMRMLARCGCPKQQPRHDTGVVTESSLSELCGTELTNEKKHDTTTVRRIDADPAPPSSDPRQIKSW